MSDDRKKIDQLLALNARTSVLWARYGALCEASQAVNEQASDGVRATLQALVDDAAQELHTATAEAEALARGAVGELLQ